MASPLRRELPQPLPFPLPQARQHLPGGELAAGRQAFSHGQAVRLARALYHADWQAIDETCERGEDFVWRYRGSSHASRAANAVIQAELTRVGAAQLTAVE